MNPREKIMTAMKKELSRSIKRLRIDNFESPYFISYLLREFDNFNVWGTYGAIFYGGTRERYRNIYAEVRVGDYDFDNTIDGGINDNSKDNESYNYISAPIDDDIDAFRLCLWRLTDLKYKEALAQLFAKKSRMLKEVLEGKECHFSKEKRVFHRDPSREGIVPMKEWEDLIRRCTVCFKKYKKLNNSWIQIRGTREKKFFVNTDGSEIITENDYFRLLLFASTLADDGMPLDNSWNFLFRNSEEFPSEEKILQEMTRVVEELMQIRCAEILEPYAGPAILSPQASGIFFHEAVGHRLEGQRQISVDEGQTFKGKLGKRILPPFISIIDDPTMDKFDERSLYGHYRFDDEGVPGRRVVLVKDGILKNYLLSRTVVNGFRRSNGHGRNEYYETPLGRMANLIAKSSQEKDTETLRGMLLEEAVRQKKPYGLLIKSVDSGETNTTRYSFQAFSGSPKLMYKIDLDSGREKPVRGVEFIGTPLMSINKILAMGKDYEAHNSYCGAESGWVPVSTISPSVLVTEIELQRIKDRNRRPPVLPPPTLER